jgi:hypothetical protein
VAYRTVLRVAAEVRDPNLDPFQVGRQEKNEH